MDIRIDDIPLEGKQLSFLLNNELLNARIAAARDVEQVSKKVVSLPTYEFSGDTKVELEITLKGSIVCLLGSVSGEFSTPCARCGEKVAQKLEVPVDMHLKLRKEDSFEDEDVGYGYYDGETVHCSEVSEEFLVISLPIIVRCDEQSICHKENSNKKWVFGESEDDADVGDERFKILRSLKLH